MPSVDALRTLTTAVSLEQKRDEAATDAMIEVGLGSVRAVVARQTPVLKSCFSAYVEARADG